MNEPVGPGSEAEPSGPEQDKDAPRHRPFAPVLEQLRPALFSVLLLTLLTGVLFPLSLAALARPLFPRQAGGSLIVRDRSSAPS